MLKRTSALMFFVFLLGWTCFTIYAQAPTGTILGTVTDSSGAVIPGAAVTITNKATSIVRNLTANAEGLYSAPALPPGQYEVRTEMEGFRTLVREAQVLAGSSTTVDMSMSLGATREVVTVEAATAQVNYESHTIAGVVERQNIQELPINGRSFLSLAAIEPGVAVNPGTPAQFNSLVSVTTLGGGGYTRLTMDGGIINDEWEGTGSTSMNFSQEIVQEFQMSTVNFDITSGIGTGGQVNIVTRSGSNDFHGSGYFFFRDHNMAAYPGLKRDRRNPDPFFVRRNPGFWVGGPILKDKLFFFSNFEYMNQTQVYTINQDLPSLSGLSGAFLSPYHNKLLTERFDYRISSKHSLFARYSHDGNLTWGPYGGSQPEPSSWSTNRNWSDQSIMGITSTISPTMVNAFRFQYHYWASAPELTTAAQCPASNCPGLGLPSLVSMIGSASFYGGMNDNSPQPRQARVYEFGDDFSWQKGSHRIRFGVDFERIVTKNLWQFCSLGCLSVYSPESTLANALPGLVAQYLPNLPSKISTTADLLELPVSNASASIYSGVDVGFGNFPGLYEFDQGKGNNRPKFYVADTWKVTPNLTLNGALGYEFETNLWFSNLPMPAYLAPIVGANNVHPPPVNYLDFAPQFGFAWSLGKDKRTVIRGGAGLFWDSEPTWHHFRADSSLGPLGDGRSTLTASSLTNTFPNIVNLSTGKPVNVGDPLPLLSLTNMTLGQFIQIYNQQIPLLSQQLAPTPPKSGPFSVSGIDVAKQGVELHFPNFPLMRSYQTSIGMQRDLGHDMVVTADWARRQFENVDLGELDLNRFARPSGPVIPVCTASQRNGVVGIPGQECSIGTITFWVPQGRSVYDALLVKLQKRMSYRFQAIVSYALQKQVTVNAPTLNLDNYFATYGPNLATHNLNTAILADLPWGFKLSINNSIISRSPVIPFLPGLDILGVGATTYLSAVAPGLGYNCFAAGCGKSDLTKAVDSFNATYAGKKDARGTTIPQYAVPSDYQFGDPRFDTDARVTKEFAYRERYKLQVFGEFFNAFNIANLVGYSFNLDRKNPDPNKQNFSFGQPTGRFGQVFGSGGPRAIQVGARISF
ncbi:MAG TPA: carboxypeptidase regulatory-like domain-containing protein [Bryobacteraceae bacterium]|nr:carboxypeptidase regulatory-like domain-containing protein [Bryobacteraceae bacterium]